MYLVLILKYICWVLMVSLLVGMSLCPSIVGMCACADRHRL